MKRLNFLIGAIAIFGSTLFFSCENEKWELRKDATDMATDDALVSKAFSDILKSADDAEQKVDNQLKSGYKSAMVDSCPKITWTSGDSVNFYPLTITIDFGEGCIDEYLDTRKGKIIIEISDRYINEGSVRSFTLENYYLNDIQVEGTKTVTNMGKNDSDNTEFKIEISGGKIKSDSYEVSYNSSRVREWVEGEGTWTIWDDAYQVSGTADGVNSNGKSYTQKTLAPVEWNFTCRFPVTGIIELTLEGEDPIELDYGTGECDAEATVSRSDVSTDIVLRTRKKLVN